MPHFYYSTDLRRPQYYMYSFDVSGFAVDFFFSLSYIYSILVFFWLLQYFLIYLRPLFELYITAIRAHPLKKKKSVLKNKSYSNQGCQNSKLTRKSNHSYWLIFHSLEQNLFWTGKVAKWTFKEPKYCCPIKHYFMTFFIKYSIKTWSSSGSSVWNS